MAKDLRFLFFCCAYVIIAGYEIKVGMIFPLSDAYLVHDIGYAQSAGAASLALKTLEERHVLPNITFNVTVQFSECNIYDSLGNAVDFVVFHNIDLIIGPPCKLPAEAVGLYSSFQNRAILLWGLVASARFNDIYSYSTMISAFGNAFDNIRVLVLDLAYAINTISKEFEWTDMAFLYADDQLSKCADLVAEMSAGLALFAEYRMNIAFKERINNITIDYLKEVLQRASLYARIFSLCFHSDDDKRQMLLAIYDLHYNNPEYVFIFIEDTNLGFGTRTRGSSFPFFNDTASPTDGKNELAFEAAKFSFVLSFQTTTDDLNLEFREESYNYVYGWPFNCTTLCDQQTVKQASTYSIYLHDSIIVYGYMLSKAIAKHGETAIGSPELILKYAEGSYPGYKNSVIRMNANGTRYPTITLKRIYDSTKSVTVLTLIYTSNGTTLYKNYTDEGTEVWYYYNNTRPLSIPKCGFTGSRCSPSLWEENNGLFIALIVIGVLLVAALIIASFCLLSSNKREKALLDQRWKISSEMLREYESKRDTASQSSHSLTSSTHASIRQTKIQSKNHCLYNYGDEVVVVRTYQSLPVICKKVVQELRYLVTIEHDHLNKFMGLSINGLDTLAVWKLCERGSLYDLIAKCAIKSDGFFMLCIIKDIVEGLVALDKSLIQCHGHLTSKNCLVTSNWEVQISDYGLIQYRTNMQYREEDLLWTAPEILRSIDRKGTSAGDIYSFAIVCSEVLTQKPAWDIKNRSETAEELIYLVQRSYEPSVRPELIIDPEIEIHSALPHLVQDCWADDPANRPNITTVQKLLKAMSKKQARNLIDHLFLLLEKEAKESEAEVQERTMRLAEEKKKTDEVLTKMLPAQVAERLKNGEPVEPEFFESVTILLSDIVSFTKIASQCTPMQVIDLLDTVYANVDSIVEKFNIYKVETIGDGYLCVSGLPFRNGNLHAKDIANMAIAEVKYFRSVRIDHLPEVVFATRIGIHTGSCVAGVVGTTMPRYCIFGDSITVTSQLETSGKGNLIHLSPTTHAILEAEFGDYIFQERGEIILKKVGKMVTYWLLGKKNASADELLKPYGTSMYQAFKTTS